MRILITGASKRIGASLVTYFAKQGHQIILHYNGSKKSAEILFEEIGGEKKSHQLVQADLKDSQQISNLITKVGAFDVLINNASTYNRLDLKDVAYQQALDDYQINFFVPFFLMQEFFNRYKKGKIINFLDERICRIEPSAGIYAFAKKSLRDATLATALEWSPTMTVNAIAPGSVLAPDGMDEEIFQKQWQKTPAGKVTELEEICQACDFLINSSTITGQILFLDGGSHLTKP